jgi:branched-subunit amino acid permease
MSFIFSSPAFVGFQRRGMRKRKKVFKQTCQVKLNAAFPLALYIGYNFMKEIGCSLNKRGRVFKMRSMAVPATSTTCDRPPTISRS